MGAKSEPYFVGIGWRLPLVSPPSLFLMQMAIRSHPIFCFQREGEFLGGFFSMGARRDAGDQATSQQKNGSYQPRSIHLLYLRN
jgi:hypothetical protein